MKLETRAGARLPSWHESDRLIAMHKIGDQYWRFSMTPAGDRFFVEPYEGPLGIMRIDLGGWRFREATFCGSLLARDKAVYVGQGGQGADHEFVRSWKAPVGDYTPSLIDVRYGSLVLSLSNNAYVDVLSDDHAPHSACVLQVREDTPCVLRLSGKGKILFALPGEGTRARPGDELLVAPILVDSTSDLMIRGLRRRAHERVSPAILAPIGLMIAGPLGLWITLGRNRRRYRYLPLFSGIGLLALAGYLGGLFALNALLHPEHSRRAFEDLTPTVTIARVNGEIVARGVMPFG